MTEKIVESLQRQSCHYCKQQLSAGTFYSIDIPDTPFGIPMPQPKSSPELTSDTLRDLLRTVAKPMPVLLFKCVCDEWARVTFAGGLFTHDHIDFIFSWQKEDEKRYALQQNVKRLRSELGITKC